MHAPLKNHDPDDDLDFFELLKEVVAEPDHWLDTRNDQLGGRMPRELLGTTEEVRLRELAKSIKHGMPT